MTIALNAADSFTIGISMSNWKATDQLAALEFRSKDADRQGTSPFFSRQI